MELSSTAYVILGMISREPRSGYEIKALVDSTTRFFWAASYGQIYPELKRLSAAGLIEAIDAPRGGRKRTVYAISPAGVGELEDWLREPPQTFEMREEGLLKLFFAGALPAADAAKTLRAMRVHRLELARRLQGMEPKALAMQDPFPLIVLQGGIEFNQWFAEWCERIERQLEERSAKRAAGDV
jgi:PadR family transcriptional regulator, regulatory protein AphA